MTSAQVMFALTRPGAPFAIRQKFCVVPNLSWGLLHWEADLCAVTNSRRLYECEIKVSASDWKADALKTKWRNWEFYKNQTHYVTPHRFFYAAPDNLAMRWEEFGIPAFAGVIAIKEKGPNRELRAEVIRPHTDIKGARLLTEKEMVQVARLGSMRFWGENHKRVQREAGLV